MQWSGFESDSTSHLVTQARTLSLTDPFLTSLKLYQGMCFMKVKLSILIYLYRSWCSICKQLHRGLSLKKSFQTLLYALQNNSTLFPINNMSFTYTYQKWCSAPTHFLVNTGFTASLYNTISFDQLIKVYIPTPRCLHQSIDGSLELAYFVSTFRIDKTFLLHHIQLFNKSIKKCSFVYPIARFHKMWQLLTWFKQT